MTPTPANDFGGAPHYFSPSTGNIWPGERAPTKWIPVAQELPPEGEIVLTKIDDARGCRSERYMHRHGALWYWGAEWRAIPPTHWARD